MAKPILGLPHGFGIPQRLEARDRGAILIHQGFELAAALGEPGRDACCAAACSPAASRRERLIRTHASPKPHASAPDAAIVAPAMAWLCPAICSVN